MAGGRDEDRTMPARTVTPASPERQGDPADRRGPFRPERLVTRRARQSGRQAAHGFRLVDVIAPAVVSVVSLEVVNDEPVFDLAVSRALPIIAAAIDAGRLLRSVGIYRFGRRERAYVAHAVGVAGVVVAGALAGVLIVADRRPGRAGPATSCRVGRADARRTARAAHRLVDRSCGAGAAGSPDAQHRHRRRHPPRRADRRRRPDAPRRQRARRLRRPAGPLARQRRTACPCWATPPPC